MNYFQEKVMCLLRDKPPVWFISLIAILIALVTFPAVAPVFSNGIDPPLAWVFNYLINGHISLGKQIIFPHGPFAFFMYPLPVGYNLQIVLITALALRMVFAWLFLRTYGESGGLFLLAALITFVFLGFFDFLLVIIALVILFHLLFLDSGKSFWIIPSVVLTVFALYIKAFVGIVCVILLADLFILVMGLAAVRKLKWNKLIPFLLFPGLMLVVWSGLYGTPSGFLRYLYGMMQLAGDNSAAVAYYPDNNWWQLSLAFVMLLVLVILHFRQKGALQFIILLAPAAFAVWKYGMAREDYLHEGMFFLFMLMVVGFFQLIVKRLKYITAIIGLFVLLMLYLNFRNALYFEPPVFSVSGMRQLNSFLLNTNGSVDTCASASFRNIERNILNPRIREQIGNQPVDVYPWDYSFIPANMLNWKPRPVLQSYAGYTPWLDKENATHFNSSDAPEFLIWELRKITHDIHNGTMESIDGRYLLNDHPDAVLAILSRYRLVDRQVGRFPVLLFKKRENTLTIHKETLSLTTGAWNEWIDVPDGKTFILRAKAKLERSLVGNLKSFLYKDEACYMYYLLENGEVRMFRIVPGNAIQGVWVNPLILNGESARAEPRVKKIMFRSTNPAMMKDSIPLEWENIRLGTESNPGAAETLLDFLGKDAGLGRELITTSMNDMEKDYRFWSSNPAPVTDMPAYSGKTSCKVSGNAFSMSYEIPLDSLSIPPGDTSILIRASAWFNTQEKPDASLVISVEKNGESLAYKGVELNGFCIQKGTWNYACNFIEADRNLMASKGLSLKVYVWNKGHSDVLVDDMEVIVERWP